MTIESNHRIVLVFTLLKGFSHWLEVMVSNYLLYQLNNNLNSMCANIGHYLRYDLLKNRHVNDSTVNSFTSLLYKTKKIARYRESAQ